MFVSLPKNTEGRDFFVGDIHGCFYLLTQALEHVDFDTNRDRLISTGDLIDRGEFSEEVAYWLSQPYFHAVRGNHEQVLLDAVSGLSDERYHRMMGGDWWYDLGLDRTTQKHIVEYLRKLPLMLEVETEQGRIGLVHAGWRGALGRIGSRVVERMTQEYGSDPRDILAGVGPSICPDCFEVGHNVAEEFIAAYPGLPCVLEQENARPHVDLWMVAFRQFVEAGVLPEHISLFDVCTMTTPRLYSHRRDKGNTGGMAAYLRILP